jgi:DNA-binding response OmpR family regulator
MKRILIVEDMIELALLLREAARSCGYQADLACNGRDAMVRTQVRNYDLIITDIIMPEKDGLELCRYIRETNTSVPIIAISGGAHAISTHVALAAAGQHADVVLEKPIDFEALIKTMRTLLGDGEALPEKKQVVNSY